MILTVEVPNSPLDFNINDKYRGRSAITPRVREAIKGLYATTIRSILEQDYVPPVPQRFRVHVTVRFPNGRGDIDNPYKRIQDAVFDGMKFCYPERKINDSQVFRMEVDKVNVLLEGGLVGVRIDVHPWSN